jgi:hypothetical protein
MPYPKNTYFRNYTVKPEWYDRFSEMVATGTDPEEVVDLLAHLATGISGEEENHTALAKYAQHVRTHIKAAMLAGVAYAKVLQEETFKTGEDYVESRSNKNRIKNDN